MDAVNSLIKSQMTIEKRDFEQNVTIIPTIDQAYSDI
jgi:hypothetical protein